MAKYDYTYYEVMLQDAKDYHKPYLNDIYNMAVSGLQEVDANASYTGPSISANLLSMAQAEANKEMLMLNTIFGQNLNLKITTPQDCKQLVDAINSAFHFKAVLERNKSMIKGEGKDSFGSGIKAVFSWFPTYFNAALKRALPTILSEMKGSMLANHSLPAGEAAKQAFLKRLPEISMYAVDRMFSKAEVERSTDPKYADAYREILNAIQSDFANHRSNVFLDRLMETYKLADIGDFFSQAVVDNKGAYKNRLKKAYSLTTNKINNLGGENIYTKGGYTLEGLVDQALSMVGNAINGTTTADGTPIQASGYDKFGQLNARPDNVFTFNIPKHYLDDTVNQIERTEKEQNRNRLTDAEAFSNLMNNISNIKDGFIVYFNDKNYNVGNGKGHKGAENVSLGDLPAIMANGPVGDVDQVIYNIMQMGEGAIGEGNDYGASEAIAASVAHFLFDDYNTIGAQTTGGNAIHIMTVEGMMVPLSTYLFALGSALQEAEHDISGFAKASISPIPIEFGKGVKGTVGGARFDPANWDVQSNDTLSKTKISINFLRNIQDFVKGYL